VEAQAEQVLKNMSAIVEAGGSSMANVLKCTVLLRSMTDFVAVNAVYAKVIYHSLPASHTLSLTHLLTTCLHNILVLINDRCYDSISQAIPPLVLHLQSQVCHVMH
jgi:enamine deaminase RidA (YjgF/YER057c/UK114 family)